MTHPLDSSVEALDVFRMGLNKLGGEDVRPELVAFAERHLKVDSVDEL